MNRMESNKAMNRLSIVTLVLSIFACTPSFAENRWFVGGAGGLASFDDEIDVVDTGNVSLKFGYALGDYLEFGASYGFTLLTDDINNVDHDLDIGFAYVKGKLPINDTSLLYLMFGASQLKLTEAIRDSSSSTEDKGNGFGIGVEVRGRNSVGYSAEYVIYYDDDEFDGVDVDVNSSGFNFGFVKYF